MSRKGRDRRKKNRLLGIKKRIRLDDGERRMVAEGAFWSSFGA